MQTAASFAEPPPGGPVRRQRQPIPGRACHPHHVGSPDGRVSAISVASRNDLALDRLPHCVGAISDAQLRSWRASSFSVSLTENGIACSGRRTSGVAHCVVRAGPRACFLRRGAQVELHLAHRTDAKLRSLAVGSRRLRHVMPSMHGRSPPSSAVGACSGRAW
jgi:hypothetical protein